MNSINYDLINFGYFKINNFFNQNEIVEIENIFEDILEEKFVNQSTAKINYNEIYKYRSVNQVYKKLHNFLNDKINYNFYLRNVWFIKTQNQHIREELPFIAHIDKKRYLKVFLYINDIKKKNGAFTVSSNSNPKQNEVLRLNWWKENIHDPEKDKHGLLCSKKDLKFVPIEMEKGSIVCFDTNTPHFAGKVEIGEVRKVLRFNFFFDAHVSKLSFLKQKSIAVISKNINYLKDLIS